VSQAHPEWWQTINNILVDHEERILALEKDFSDSGDYTYNSPLPYPERNDKRVLALEIEVARLKEEVEYLRKFVHQYVNRNEGEHR
jgi:hypothetical protein